MPDNISPYPASDTPGRLLLIDACRRRAAAQPGDIAYTFLADGEGAEQNLTYGELDRRASGLARELQRSFAPGDRALLVYDPGLDYVVAVLGCFYAGLVAVPAYPPDPLRLRRTLIRLRAILDDARAAVILGNAATLATLPASDTAAARRLVTDTLPDGEGGWSPPALNGDNLALLQYTSGSTGMPRGVMVTHANLAYQVERMSRWDSDDAVGVTWLPFYHDLGLVAGVLAPLYSGRRTVALAPLAFVQRPARWLWAMSRYRGTATGGPNFAYDLCVRKVSDEEYAALDLSRWRVALTGAEPVRAETLARFEKRFGPRGFRPEAWVPAYGLAEATLGVTGPVTPRRPVVRYFHGAGLNDGRATPAAAGEAGARALVGCGPPLEGTEVVTAHPERRTACPDGEVGEIWARGPGVGHGYWGRPEETAAIFQARLADTGRGPFLRTGDLGFALGGELFVVGRLKELIVLAGKKYFPHDIEETVARCHPALKRNGGAAFGVEEPGGERLVVVQEVQRPRQLDLNAVVASIRRAVRADHALNAGAVVLIKAGSLPKTSSGKIQRGETRRRFLNGGLEAVARWEASAKEGAEARSLPTPSAGEVLAWLLNELSRHLGVPRDEIDATRPITSYVVDSISLVTMTLSLEQRLRRALTPQLLFDAPSLEQLAARLADPCRED